MCDPCCLIVGYTPVPKAIGTPTGHIEPPQKIICPHCSLVSKAVYRQDDYVFNLCFIPLCACWSGEPYLACDNCRTKIPMIRGDPCRSCGVSRPFDAEYCPNCGVKISGGEGRPISVH